MRRSLEIIIASILVIIVFGIVHNQITIRISPYFFTDILPQHPWTKGDNLTLLALAWGVTSTSTWWLRLIGGFVLAFFARIGNEPRIIVSDLVRPALVAIIMSIVLEIFIFLFFYPTWYVTYSELNIHPIVKEKLIIVSGLHDVSYLAGGIVFIGLTIWIIIARFWMRRNEKKKRPVDSWD